MTASGKELTVSRTAGSSSKRSNRVSAATGSAVSLNSLSYRTVTLLVRIERILFLSINLYAGLAKLLGLFLHTGLERIIQIVNALRPGVLAYILGNFH